MDEGVSGVEVLPCVVVVVVVADWNGEVEDGGRFCSLDEGASEPSLEVDEYRADCLPLRKCPRSRIDEGCCWGVIIGRARRHLASERISMANPRSEISARRQEWLFQVE